THKIGRRKNSVARVYLKEGSGKFTINGRDGKNYFPTALLQYKLEQPFALTNTTGQYDVVVSVFGGGTTGQVEAVRLGISRCLVLINEENKPLLKPAGLLTRDPRMVERKKFGQKKARKRFQFSKHAGVHFGHLTRKWNPNMAPYIFMEKNGIHIIDLHKTAVKLDEASEALNKIASSGRKVLFVATKKQAKDIVAKHAESINMPYITERWPGGMLTNFVTIRKAVKKMNSIDKMKKDGTFETLSKKERLQIDRLRANLEKNLGSIADMT
ncbi:unnamed protein product, partial [Darwinula stevensoni]